MFNRGNISSVTRLTYIDSSTPKGLRDAFHLGGSDCLALAKSIKDPINNTTGRYIVTFHAIELALKAYLAKHGIGADTLRKAPFGHNLVGLYGEAKTHGLSVTVPNTDELLVWINEWHDRGAALRYEFAGHRELPMCEMLFPIAEQILAAARGRLV